MKRVLILVFRSLVLLVGFGLLGGGGLYAQDVEDFYARMLEQEVEVVNPVKRPVISLGAGIVNYLGEIRNEGDNHLLGSWAARMNVSTLLGKSKQIKMNVYVMYGILEGQDMGYSRIMNTQNLPVVSNKKWYVNSAFRTEFYEIGFSGEYNFWHLIGTRKTVRPYVSLGAGLFLFTPKANYLNNEDKYYHFWDDGTVHLVEQDDPKAVGSPEVRMDRFYETDMKRANLFEYPSFPPVTAVFPAEAGVDFYISNRVYFRVFTSLHYTLSDLVDGFDKRVADRYGLKASPWHDMFAYTGFSLHMDFFSQSESFIVDKVFADLEDFDYEVFFADQDGDGVFDHLDECADTPQGVAVDSVGCPLDMDGDGVPDYLDKELDTPPDTPVDAQGVALTARGMTLPELKDPPVERSKIRLLPVSTIWSRRYEFTVSGIPDKFRQVDIDGDGYISYDEVIRAVDDFFTGESPYSSDEIYELNAYFFTQ